MLLFRRSSLILRPSSVPFAATRLLSTSRTLLNKHFDDLSKTPKIPTEPIIKSKERSRYSKIIDRLPKRFQKYGQRLVNSPIEHVVSFLTLHELSAVVPFLGLWWAFHHFGFLPADIPSWVIIKGSGFIEKIIGDAAADWSLQDRTRVIIEGATAYGIVKAFFPIRVVGSIFLTPWFSRHLIEPIFRGFRSLVGRISGGKPAPVEAKKLEIGEQPTEKKLLNPSNTSKDKILESQKKEEL